MESMSSFEKGEKAHRTLSVLQVVHLESRNISVIVLLGKFLGNITPPVLAPGLAITGGLFILLECQY